MTSLNNGDPFSLNSTGGLTSTTPPQLNSSSPLSNSMNASSSNNSPGGGGQQNLNVTMNSPDNSSNSTAPGIASMTQPSFNSSYDSPPPNCPITTRNSAVTENDSLNISPVPNWTNCVLAQPSANPEPGQGQSLRSMSNSGQVTSPYPLVGGGAYEARSSPMPNSNRTPISSEAGGPVTTSNPQLGLSPPPPGAQLNESNVCDLSGKHHLTPSEVAAFEALLLNAAIRLSRSPGQYTGYFHYPVHSTPQRSRQDSVGQAQQQQQYFSPVLGRDLSAFLDRNPRPPTFLETTPPGQFRGTSGPQVVLGVPLTLPGQNNSMGPFTNSPEGGRLAPPSFMNQGACSMVFGPLPGQNLNVTTTNRMYYHNNSQNSEGMTPADPGRAINQQNNYSMGLETFLNQSQPHQSFPSPGFQQQSPPTPPPPAVAATVAPGGNAALDLERLLANEETRQLVQRVMDSVFRNRFNGVAEEITEFVNKAMLQFLTANLVPIVDALNQQGLWPWKFCECGRNNSNMGQSNGGQNQGTANNQRQEPISMAMVPENST